MERHYSKNHIWLVKNGETVRLGLTEYAVERLGSIMFLNLPEEGETLSAGERFGDVESIKTVSDLISPVTGEVLRVNEDLLDELESIPDAPYESWLLEVRADAVLDDLMDEATYLDRKESL